MQQYNKTTQKMVNFDDVTKGNTHKKNNLNLPQIPDHADKILIIQGSGSRKTNSLFNLITQPSNIGPQDVPLQFHHDMTSWGRLEMTSRGHPNLKSKGHPLKDPWNVP